MCETFKSHLDVEFGWLIGAAERRVRSQLSFSFAPTGTSDGDEEREWIIFISEAGAPQLRSVISVRSMIRFYQEMFEFRN